MNYNNLTGFKLHVQKERESKQEKNLLINTLTEQEIDIN